MKRRFAIGAELVRDQGAHVRVWAPTHPRVTLVIEAPMRAEVTMEREPSGHHVAFVRGMRAGARYRFRLGDDPQLLADPASRYQPEGPLGPSEIVDPHAFAWTDHAWTGIAPEQHVIYEMHVGTFTHEGTWAAAAAHLPRLAELGITTIEMMPVNDLAGRHNWGYDGVNLWAPTRNYGTPDDLRRFVDRAHALGLAVIHDVVYNHFGPSGNQMFTWAPSYRGAAGEWGDSINFDGEGSHGVREFFIANAAYWIDELHFDGLRVDATQAIRDTSERHVLAEIVAAARAAAPHRTLFLVGENEPQDRAQFGHGFDALWNDDFHHTARVALTGVTEGYLHDYRGTPQELVSSLVRGFLYQGQLYRWQSNPRGTPTRGLPHRSFVHFLENHDQVANIGFGERLVELADPATLRAMTAVLLLGPQLPMLFQGQEHGARQPWGFFADHGEELHEPIRRGRAAFVAQFARISTPESQAALADPCDEATFRACKLDPAERERDTPWWRLHRDLLRLRRERAQPRDVDGAVLGPHTFCVRFADDHLLLVNLGPTFTEAVLPEPLLAAPPGTNWRTAWSSEDPRYGGHGTPPVFTRQRLAIPARAAVLMAPDPGATLRVDPPPPSGAVEV